MLVLLYYNIILFQLVSNLVTFIVGGPISKIFFALTVIFIFVFIAKMIQKKIMKDDNR